MLHPEVTGGTDYQESQLPQLKPLEEKLQKLVHDVFESAGANGQRLKNFLHGTWIGEPLHVILTDVPIGAWTVALVFDGLEWSSGREQFALAADTSVGIGLVAALATAVTGLTDWSDVPAPARRIGLIHGLLNITATSLFATSLLLRKRASRPRGRILAGVGYAVMTVAAHLGGKLVYEHRVGVDRTDGQVFPQKFISVMEESRLGENKPTRAQVDGVPILLVRKDARIFALAGTCSHWGGPLAEGKLEGNSIVCPWHGSRFALEDGRVLDGPAVHTQPCLNVRVRNRQIEVCRNVESAAKAVDITESAESA